MCPAEHSGLCHVPIARRPGAHSPAHADDDIRGRHHHRDRNTHGDLNPHAEPNPDRIARVASYNDVCAYD
jgi:hypothetical protein